MQHLSKSVHKRRGISLSSQHRHNIEKQRQIVNIPQFHSHSRIVQAHPYPRQVHVHKFINLNLPIVPSTIYHKPRIQFTYNQPSQVLRGNFIVQTQVLNHRINSIQKQIVAKSKLLHTIKRNQSTIKFIEQTPVNDQRGSKNRVENYQNQKIQQIFNNVNIPNIQSKNNQNQQNTILNQVKQQSNVQLKNQPSSKDNNFIDKKLLSTNNKGKQKKVKFNDENTPQTSEQSDDKKNQRKTIDPQKLKLMQSKLLDIIRACSTL